MLKRVIEYFKYNIIERSAQHEQSTWLVHYCKILTLLLKINVILFEIRLLVVTIYSSLKFYKNKLSQQISCDHVSC